MSTLFAHLRPFIAGVFDCLSFHTSARYLFTSKGKKRSLLRSNIGNYALFSFVIYMSTNFAIDYFAYPFLNNAVENGKIASFAVSFLYAFYFLTLNVFWRVFVMVPATLVAQGKWCVAVSDTAVAIAGTGKKETGSADKLLFDEIFACVFRILYALQYALLFTVYKHVPAVIAPFFALCLVIIDAMYQTSIIFDYVGYSQQYEAQRRVMILERRWEYAIGFGLPISVLSFFFPFVVKMGVVAAIVPFLIIHLAANAKSSRWKPSLSQDERILPNTLPVFNLVSSASHVLLSIVKWLLPN